MVLNRMKSQLAQAQGAETESRTWQVMLRLTPTQEHPIPLHTIWLQCVEKNIKSHV